MFLCCRILAVALLLGIVSYSYGSQPRITKSSLSSMLQQPTVSAMHKDRKGLIWIGTQQGLHRFDGANLTVFDSARSNRNWIPQSDIKDIAEDSEGNLLVATSGGLLLRMNPRTETFDAIKISVPEGKANLIRLLVSSSGSIWVLRKDGLMLFDATFQNSQDWSMSLNLVHSIGSLNDFVEDKLGDLWVGGSLGLAHIHTREKSFESFDLGALQLTDGAELTALEITSDGNLIIGTNIGRLAVWDVFTSKPLANKEVARNTANYISEFEVYGDLLVIGTDRGLFTSDKSLSSIHDLSASGDGLTNPDVYSLLLDGKYIWIGTVDGLNIFSVTPFDLFNGKNSDVSNDVMAFEEDNFGRIWIGTFYGVYRYEEATRKHSRIELETGANEYQRVATLAARGTELWMGFLRGGLYAANTDDAQAPKPPNLIRMNSINDLVVTKILAGRSDTDIWIATYNHGLFRITEDDTYSYYGRNTLPEKTITLLFWSKAKKLLAVSENRIYKYDPIADQFRTIHFDFQLGKIRPFVYSIAQASNDDILFGTKDYGLFIWPEESQRENQFHLTAATQSGLETSTIYGIEPDSQRNLWCSTQNGIVKLNSDGRLIRRFTTADGLQGNDFALGASFTSRKGLIYFGGVNGYNRFDPNEVSIDTAPSPMRLTAINFPKKDERNLGTIDQLKSLLLTHQDHFVTFQFSVLDFISPEKNQFRFKLENFDTDWVENGTRNTATYTNLPAGDYVFRVQGANSAGIWNRDGITLAVRVLPPPWFSWWAYSIYGIVLLLLGWCAHRIYHSYAIDRKSAQMAMQMFEDANRADDEMQEQLEVHDELIQSAFQHHLTTLSLVSDFISHRGSKEPDDHLCEVTESGIKRIAALSILESCLYYQAGDSVTDLHKYTENVVPVLLKSTSVASETIVTINEVTSILLPTEIATPLSVVIYELLENCMQHAFEVTSPANYIHIKMFFNPNSASTRGGLVLSIQDSGIGLPDSIENLALESAGIGIVQSIVKKLGGTLQCSDNKGTTISITFPDTDVLYGSGDQSNPN